MSPLLDVICPWQTPCLTFVSSLLPRLFLTPQLPASPTIWTWNSAICFEWPCLSQGGWNGDLQRSLFHLNCSVRKNFFIWKRDKNKCWILQEHEGDGNNKIILKIKGPSLILKLIFIYTELLYWCFHLLLLVTSSLTWVGPSL